MQALAVKTTGERIVFYTGWGSTETAPTSTGTYWDTERVGLIGLPFPGVELKMVPCGSKYELRLRGVNVTPGYFGQPDLTKKMFDEEGFYCIGDAGIFVDDTDPVKGGKVEQVKAIIAYGKTRNVGVWLYLNDVGGRKFPLEETLKQYGEWGAAGVKYGFMNGSPEEKNRRTRLITGLCAKNKLLCDYHDYPVHPYGQMRTWPNAVTREFCQAQLDGHKVFQPQTFVTSVFVNMLSGPLDMNNGLADLTQAGRVDHGVPVPSTLTAEVARTLIVFSGATVIPDLPEY
jgi:hypothetical protein